MLTQSDVEREYENAKRHAEVYLQKNRLELASSCVALSANLAYHFMLRYVDDDLEDLVRRLSNATIPKRSCAGNATRIVFYDTYGIPQRGLTQQYLRAFDQLGVEVLYVYDAPGGYALDPKLRDELINMKSLRILLPQKHSSLTDKLSTLSAEICHWNPSSVFLHITPWSVDALMLWHSIVGPRKFLVDITDHAFWLGKSFVHAFLEFSKYGISIATTHRGISTDRLRLIPYYPILDDQVPFQGWPVPPNGKVILFTGGNIYKMLDEKDTFFYSLKQIVERREDCVIYVATTGDNAPLKKFISQSNLESKIFPLGNRRDFASLVQNCDIYLDTYPISGGLTTQFAYMLKRPVITIKYRDILGWSTEEMLYGTSSDHHNNDDEEYFMKRIDLIIESRENNEFDGLEPTGFVSSSCHFSKAIDNLLKGKSDSIPTSFQKTQEFDEMAIKEHYLALENKFFFELPIIQLKHLRLHYFRLNPIRSLLGLSAMIFRPRNNLFKRAWLRLHNLLFVKF
jgi:hypothetical protein